MAFIDVDLKVFSAFQSEIRCTEPELKKQIGCKDALIDETIVKLQAGIVRAEEEKKAADASLQKAIDDLCKAERYTRNYNAHLAEGESPIETSRVYYDCVDSCERAANQAYLHLADAKATLASFKQYVNSYRQQQEDGYSSFVKLLQKSGQFFLEYVDKLIKAKKCICGSETVTDAANNACGVSVAAVASGSGIGEDNAVGSGESPTSSPSHKSDTGREQNIPISEKIAIADRNGDILAWSGTKGDSLRVPKNKNSDLAKELRSYGVDGIVYRAGDVDFSPTAHFNVPFDNINALYSELNRRITFGRLIGNDGIKTRKEFSNIIRTTWQSMAREQLVNRIRSDSAFANEFARRTGINTAIITNSTILGKELSRVGLTLHETTDCSGIQLVSTRIHDAFKHQGGVAEMLEKLISGNIHAVV